MKKILHILTATALLATVFGTSCKKDEKDLDLGGSRGGEKTYDCPRLKKNFREECTTEAGEKGFVNADCECQTKNRETEDKRGDDRWGDDKKGGDKKDRKDRKKNRKKKKYRKNRGDKKDGEKDGRDRDSDGRGDEDDDKEGDGDNEEKDYTGRD